MDMSFSPVPEAPVLVIGAAGVDIVGRLLKELQMGTSNPAVIRTSYGGVARNVAENLARLGQSVRLLTAVGNDQAGDQLLQHTAAAGVDVEGALRVSDTPTGTYLAGIDLNGKLGMGLDDMRVIKALSPGALDERQAMFEDASALFVDANLRRETLSHAFSMARRAGIPICADPTSARLARKLRLHIKKFDLVTPNLKEAAILCDATSESQEYCEGLEIAKRLVELGAGIAVVTMAEAGVTYADQQTSGRVPAIRTEVVDPTGGGDALTATILFALLNNIPLDDAVRLGVSAATLTLRYPGAVAPDLTLDKLYDELVI